MAEETVKYDVEGYEAVTAALKELLNQYPDRGKEEISFCVLGEKGGKAMYPVSGAVIESEKRNILGNVTEVCLYPFVVIWRVAAPSEERKVAIKEWLDNLGKWLEKKEITIKGETSRLKEYPPLTEGREFSSISRQSPAYLDTVGQDRSENWAISITARYKHEYRK